MPLLWKKDWQRVLIRKSRGSSHPMRLAYVNHNTQTELNFFPRDATKYNTVMSKKSGKRSYPERLFDASFTFNSKQFQFSKEISDWM